MAADIHHSRTLLTRATGPAVRYKLLKMAPVPGPDAMSSRETSSTTALKGGDFYISGDVETDGPIPGPYSMLAFALVAVGTFDGTHFKRFDLDVASFYRELRPISDRFQPEALSVNQLDRRRLLRDGTEPRAAMEEAAAWVREVANGLRPVLVAYPAPFDWTWLYWYFVNFTHDGSPFGFSSCLDIKTMIAVKQRVSVAEAKKHNLPPGLRPQRRHTHHALDDAKEQAELFANLFDWSGCR